jgi:arsenate reductase-like glutaredoxin family protein
LNHEEWIKVISENPVLLRRPVILSKHKGIIGDPAWQIEKIL